MPICTFQNSTLEIWRLIHYHLSSLAIPLAELVEALRRHSYFIGFPLIRLLQFLIKTPSSLRFARKKLKTRLCFMVIHFYYFFFALIAFSAFSSSFGNTLLRGNDDLQHLLQTCLYFIHKSIGQFPRFLFRCRFGNNPYNRLGIGFA